MQQNSKLLHSLIQENNRIIAGRAKRLLARQVAESLPRNIPLDPDTFYQEFGLLIHPATRKPVPRLTDYQREFWLAGQRFKRRLVIKSQKIGLSTSILMEDFQRAITTSRGKEILIVAQSFIHAKNHLYTLRKMIMDSPKYAPFLINKPSELLLRDEVTKVSTMYIRNPDNQYKPTRIIALGPTPGGIWSWKEVDHIHVSDINAQDQMIDDSETFGAMYSRLANTNGSMVIETPTRGPSGSVYDIYTEAKLQKKPGKNDFKIFEYPADRAVKAGIITEEFLEGERKRLGPAYEMYYGCKFFDSSHTWYRPDMLQYGDYDLE